MRNFVANDYPEIPDLMQAVLDAAANGEKDFCVTWRDATLVGNIYTATVLMHLLATQHIAREEKGSDMIKIYRIFEDIKADVNNREVHFVIADNLKRDAQALADVFRCAVFEFNNQSNGVMGHA